MCAFDVSTTAASQSLSIPHWNTKVFTSKRPWGTISDDRIYQLVVKEDERPDRPESDIWGNELIPDEIWDILKMAWVKETRARPDFVKIISLWPQAARPAGSMPLSSSPVQIQSLPQPSGTF